MVANLGSKSDNTPKVSSASSPISVSVPSLKSMSARPQPFGPFPMGRRSLVEKSSLIRHISGGNDSENSGSQQSASNRHESKQAAALFQQRNAITTDNQLFLKEVSFFSLFCRSNGVIWSQYRFI